MGPFFRHSVCYSHTKLKSFETTLMSAILSQIYVIISNILSAPKPRICKGKSTYENARSEKTFSFAQTPTGLNPWNAKSKWPQRKYRKDRKEIPQVSPRISAKTERKYRKFYIESPKKPKESSVKASTTIPKRAERKYRIYHRESTRRTHESNGKSTTQIARIVLKVVRKNILKAPEWCPGPYVSYHDYSWMIGPSSLNWAYGSYRCARESRSLPKSRV